MFEPVPSIFSRLINNIRLNHLDDRTQCYNLALGSVPGTVTFTTNLDTTNHAVASNEKSDSTTDVEMTSLDIILENEEPNFLKIDVEGYETMVTKGAEKTLAKESLHSVIMELNGSGRRYGFEDVAIRQLMFDFGFEDYHYDPLHKTLVEAKNCGIKSGNTIFIKNKSLILERIKSTPKIAVNDMVF